ncbi:MAG: hypothetical protein ACJAS1_006688 [Oleiphilaceae bacterium]|jgi:hypothetical protein
MKNYDFKKTWLLIVGVLLMWLGSDMAGAGVADFMVMGGLIAIVVFIYDFVSGVFSSIFGSVLGNKKQ